MSSGKRGTKSEGLSQLNLNAAGIDVGATSHYVAVPDERAEQPLQEFEAFTADLYRLADWLTECGVETVVMESTGVYWIPLFGVLEERGFQVILVDPRRIKNVPGRKTDVIAPVGQFPTGDRVRDRWGWVNPGSANLGHIFVGVDTNGRGARSGRRVRHCRSAADDATAVAGD